MTNNDFTDLYELRDHAFPLILRSLNKLDPDTFANDFKVRFTGLPNDVDIFRMRCVSTHIQNTPSVLIDGCLDVQITNLPIIRAVDNWRNQSRSVAFVDSTGSLSKSDIQMSFLVENFNNKELEVKLYNLEESKAIAEDNNSVILDFTTEFVLVFEMIPMKRRLKMLSGN